MESIQLHPEPEPDQVQAPVQAEGKGKEIGMETLFVKMKGSKKARIFLGPKNETMRQNSSTTKAAKTDLGQRRNCKMHNRTEPSRTERAS
jgi:hypothetical protein